MTVVEVWPQNDGWSPEFLAPLLRDTGRYLLATAEPDAPEAYAQRELSLLRRKFADRPDLYSRVVMTNLATASAAHPVMANSADAVVSFDSLHVWMRHGTALTVLRAMHAALKPGGILGLVDHRAGSDTATDPTARNGYVGEAQAIALAQQAGFEFVGGSEINANPEDTRDYELGAFVLPPTYRLGDKDRSRYTAIGESDRFTLKFIKPSSQRRSAP
jgi:predicted methyltransferase